MAKDSKAQLVRLERRLRCVLVCIAVLVGACVEGGASIGLPKAGHDTQEPAPTGTVPRVPGPGTDAASSTAPAPEPPLLSAHVTPRSISLAAFPQLANGGQLPTIGIVEAGKAAAERDTLLLKDTRVVVRLGELFAEVELTQRFENPRKEPIEAVYVFPLPDNAAVSRMKMVVGDRIIEGRVDERTRAKNVYAQAKAGGYAAALLEQERANVFTQSIANLEPGRPVEVVIRYVQDISYDAGVRELVVPLVVGPRFVQGKRLERPASGTGTAKDTNAVPDASRITPGVGAKGRRSGRDVTIEVIAEPEIVGAAIESPTHAVERATDASGQTVVKLAKKPEIANRDFVLRWRAATADPDATMLLGAEGGGYFSLVVNPPDIDLDAEVGKRELLFVVDVSGSMAGAPLALAKRALALSLSKLRPSDTFNVITFAGATEKLFFEPRRATNENVTDALAFVEAMAAGGGTMMLDALDAALSPDVAAGRDRYVVFMTDGFVSIEDVLASSTRAFVDAMKAKGRRARVFGLGLGASPNRALLEAMAREGDGVAVYATSREDPARAVNAFFRYVDRAILKDVSIDWGGAKVADVTPHALPDLFASRPLVVHGRLLSAPSRPPIVHATSAKGPVELAARVIGPSKAADRHVLGVAWARARIAELDADYAAGSADARRAITELGSTFGLVTRFTSFVAVDLSRRAPQATTETVAHPSGYEEDRDGDGIVDAEEAKKVSGAKPPVAGKSGFETTPLAGESTVVARQTADDARSEAEPPPPAGAYRSGCACRAVGQNDAPNGGGGALAAFALLSCVRLWRTGPRGRGPARSGFARRERPRGILLFLTALVRLVGRRGAGGVR